MNEYVLAVADMVQTPVGILLATNAAITTAIGVLYRDSRRHYAQCQKDRERLWERIGELEKRFDT